MECGQLAGRQVLHHVSLCKRDVGYLQVGCAPYVCEADFKFGYS